MSSHQAAQFLKMDRYQGAWKLQINERFLKRAKLLDGELPWLTGSGIRRLQQTGG